MKILKTQRKITLLKNIKTFQEIKFSTTWRKVVKQTDAYIIEYIP